MKWQTKAAALMMEIADTASLSLATHHMNTPRFGHRMAKPGAYLERLSPETRATLRELKSEDVADVRVMPWWQ